MKSRKPEHQELIVDAGALPHLVDLLKRHTDGPNSWAVIGVIRRAADAITNLARDNSSIKTRVRVEGGILPLVELLEFADPKVKRAADGALRTLAFKNDENKNQVHIVQRGAVPPLVLSEDAQLGEMSAFALERLAQDTHNQAGIAHCGGIVSLPKLLESKNGSLHHNAVFALYALAG